MAPVIGVDTLLPAEAILLPTVAWPPPESQCSQARIDDGHKHGCDGSIDHCLTSILGSAEDEHSHCEADSDRYG